MARHLDGMADPDDTRWQDQDRSVGDGTGAERVRSGCRDKAVLVSLAIGGASALGLAAAHVAVAR